MARIILDFASATTCKNDRSYIERMINELAEVDTKKHEVIIKWQLFEKASEPLDPPVEPLTRSNFDYAYCYAQDLGYKTTASVFDLPSLEYLLRFDIPFVKIANRPECRWLIGKVPREIPVYASYNNIDEFFKREPVYPIEQPMWCVSKYPATFKDYDDILKDTPFNAYANISDHTTTFEVWDKYKPDIIEWHYKLEDSTGWDAGEFARTPQQLKEIL